jgi:hypothetical protein
VSLARIKTWIAGEVLTAADLNGEFNNILNNPISLISPTTGVITFSTAQTFPTNQLSGGFGQGGTRVTGLAGTLSSQSGTFTANQYVVQTTAGTGSFVVNSTGQFVVNLATAGPAVGGRDIAALFSSTYIHWYMITTGAGSTSVAGIVSTAAPPTGPVMPAGYSAWAYLGASCYTSATTTLGANHRFRGDKAFYETPIAVLTNGAATTEATISISAQIPPNSEEFGVWWTFVNVTNAAANTSLRYVTGINWQTLSQPNAVVNTGAAPSATLAVPNVDQTLFYINSGAGDATNVNIQTYTMPNGG